MGAGKTAVGTVLAAKLGAPFLDSDRAIEKAADRSIAEIFERDGEEFFRARETEVIRRLLDGPPGILSTGGGAYLSADNRDLISKKGIAVWLKADHELLWARVRHKDTRPLLRTKNPKETLARLQGEREPLYALAELNVVAEPGYAVEDMANKVREKLLSRVDVLEEVE